MGRRAVAAIVVMLAVVCAASAQQAPPPTHAQQMPVFRGGTEFVRVDAYPSKDGQIIKGLTAADFEILEDGKPQTIDSFDYVTFPTWTPDAERLRLDSDRSGFELAADPRYRVFVILVDTVSGMTGLHDIEKPLVNFVDRMVGPQDLFGLLTTRNTAKDLILSQQTTVAESLIGDLFRSANVDVDEEEDLDGCSLDAGTLKGLQARVRADQSYTALESLVAKLGSLRQERKNIIFIANSISRSKPDRALLPGRPTLPRIGVVAGVVGVGKHTSQQAADSYCLSEVQKLANIDFDSRYRALLDEARQQNVAFYPIAPAGLPVENVERQYDDLRSLAGETGGRAIVDTNDLDDGLRKIADDLSSYYLLGYYTTNTKWDGQVRKITVRLRSSGETVRARSEYRAPAADEAAALSSGAAPGKNAPPSDAAVRASALSVLDRASGLFAIYAARSGGTLTVVTELMPQAIQSGRWRDGADLELTVATDRGDVVGSAHGRIGGGADATVLTLPVSGAPARATVRVRDDRGSATDWTKLGPAAGTLVGDPMIYRSTGRVAAHPTAALAFARNERIRIQWPVLAPLERHDVRLLDRNGRAIPVELPLADAADGRTLTLQMGLSGFGAGDYLIELTATAHGVSERKLMAIRVVGSLQ